MAARGGHKCCVRNARMARDGFWSKAEIWVRRPPPEGADMAGNSRWKTRYDSGGHFVPPTRQSYRPMDQKTPATPPVAPRHPYTITTHGITIVDDYAWLKDENWQEVLRDPSILNAEIREYLEAENDYTESLLGHTAALQKTLVKEMRGRIKKDDSSVPSPDGPYAYMRKFRDGGQHEMFGRCPRDGGEIEIILDGDELAVRHDYFRFGGARHSPDHRLEAWSA